MDKLAGLWSEAQSITAQVHEAIESGLQWWGPLSFQDYVLIGSLGIGLVLLLRMRAGSSVATEPKVIKHRDTPTIERFLTWLCPPPDAVAFGHIVASFRWLPHMIVFGAPGSGKSTFMYNRILDPLVGIWALLSFLTWGLLPRRKRRGKLIVTGNFSAPFRAAVLWLIEHGFPGYIWTPNPVPGEGFGLDLTEGPPENVGERFIAMQPVGTGNTGLRSGAVEGMIVDTCYELENRQVARTIGTILALMPTVGKRPLGPDGKPDFSQPAAPLTANERAGLEDWSTRFRTLTRRLGASVGHDVKLSEVLRRGEAILIEGSSYNNPNSIEPLMQLMTVTAMWLVGEVGNFDLLIDEPGAVGPGTFTRLLTATRAKDVRILIGMQSRKQVDDTLREMCHTALLLGAAADAPEAREFESKVTDQDVPPEDFVLLEPRRWYEWLLPFWPRRGLYALEGWLFSNGRLDKVRAQPCDLRILKRWPQGSVPQIPSWTWVGSVEAESVAVPATFEIDSVVDSVCGETDAGLAFVPGEIVDGPPEMPAYWKGDAQLENIWLHHVFPGGPNGCHESTYRLNNRGRPMCSYMGVDWMAYMLSLALSDGLNLGEVKMHSAAGELTVDHRCQNIRCTRADHLTWESRSRNSELLHERKRVMARV